MHYTTQYLVIGASAAGLAAVKKLRQLDPGAGIVCVSDEQELPYNKCFLADYVSALKTEAQMHTATQVFFDEQNISLLLNTRIEKIDRNKKEVHGANGITIMYKKLLLAVGASARISPLYIGIQGCFSFYTLADANKLLCFLLPTTNQQVVVVGAGLTGLEVADALQQRGCKVTVLESADRIVVRQATPECSELIMQAAAKKGVVIRIGTVVQEVLQKNGQVQALVCSDGSIITATIVITAFGSQAQCQLALDAGIECAQGALVTDQFLQTNDSAVWAAGDVALVMHGVTGERVRTATWPDAVQQGMYAACAMAGQRKEYPGVAPVAVSSFFGHKFVSAGCMEPQTSAWSMQIKKEAGLYSQCLFDQDGKLQGYVLYGNDVSDAVRYKKQWLGR